MSVCKVHLKDVEKHFERVESGVEYAEPVYSLLDVLFVIRMTTRGASLQQEANAALDAQHKYTRVQNTKDKSLRQKFKTPTSSIEQNILTTV